MMASLACVEEKMKTSGFVNGGTTATTKTSQSTLLEEMKLLKDQSGFILFLPQDYYCKFPFHTQHFLCRITFAT